MYPENTAFSKALPTYQTAWDATSYSSLKTCPYKYYLSIVLGYQPRKMSVHLKFGIAFHQAMERFHQLRASGLDHELALHTVIMGEYYRQLLTDEERALGEGYHEHSLPTNEPTKTPHTLLRAIVWYLDTYENDTAETYVLKDGTPAVELSFRFPLFDDLTYCGHFDRIVRFNDQIYVHDYKTTKGQLNAKFFSQFSPSIQMTGYTIASQIVFNIPARGVIVDGIQMAVTSTQFARQTIYRTASQLDEFLDDLTLDLKVAKIYAEENSWPLNPTACGNYGGCSFRKVCSHSPSVRINFLKSDFHIKHWNPTIER